MTKDMISITEAAKRVGYSRQRLSMMISDAGLERVKSGKTALVDFAEIQMMLQQLAAQKKLQTPKAARKEGGGEGELVSHLKEEVRRLTEERNQAEQRYRAAESAQTELKLLQAAKNSADKELLQLEREREENERRINNLLDKIEALQASVEEAEELRAQLKAFKTKEAGSILGKASKIRDVLLGK